MQRPGATKRQKELARAEKQREKAAKREQRRQEKATFRQGWSEFGPRAFAAITLEDI